MANWLARAHTVFKETPKRPAANADVRTLTAAPTSPPSQLTELTKAPSVSFVSTHDERISQNNDPVDVVMETRRQRVLAILDANPDFRYAVVTETEADPETVVVHVGIRGIGSGEIVVAKGRYDGIELMRALENREAE